MREHMRPRVRSTFVRDSMRKHILDCTQMQMRSRPGETKLAADAHKACEAQGGKYGIRANA
eukprot:5857905-Pleurochrysis_carterae.AAC.2